MHDNGVRKTFPVAQQALLNGLFRVHNIQTSRQADSSEYEWLHIVRKDSGQADPPNHSGVTHTIVHTMSIRSTCPP